MPAKWSTEVEESKFQELNELYVIQNKTIGEIGKILHLAEATVYGRLLRLNIKPNRYSKRTCNNINNDVTIPCIHSRSLAEFFGIMLGDGCISPTQIMITLGNKEFDYVNYVSRLITKLFSIVPKIYIRKGGYYVVSFGSTKIVEWLQSNDLVFNKVKSQVKAPDWIFKKNFLMEGFLKGFFDTDGSVYKLRFGVQLAFTNKSLSLLEDIRNSLELLNYHPSKISRFQVYITRKRHVLKFFKHINPANIKHRQRFEEFVKYYSH
ncbi:MAG: LAGLIDADG family homing endonuclease [Candidatus Woesebacteria bacterium]|nr:LAGLIDADG family homing endonuclease [Candidatus Woesebacteria bacterium]